jgi:hypothetical protein
MKDQNEQTGYAYVSTGQPYNTDNFEDFFEYVGQDENGTILVRQKEDTDDAVQKASNVVAVLFGLLAKPFGG